MKNLIKKLIPKSILSVYHLFLVLLAAFWYGYPSRKLRVIGVTGTKGKSTTCFLIARILEEAGHQVALSSTALFKIGEREWLNPYKMTMLGRFALQKFIRDAVRASCDYLVLEVSSEGILQNRHRGIEFDVAVFTNLSPEHLEAHGSFEAYREAKGKLFKVLKSEIRPSAKGGSASGGKSETNSNDKNLKSNKTIIVNLDDENTEYFLKFSADKKIGYKITAYSLQLTTCDEVINTKELNVNQDGSRFMVDDTQFHLNLLGKFNIYNALAAVAVAVGEGIGLEAASRALGKVTTVPGRAEFISEGQSFKVMVDYAHEPRSLEAIFETVKMLKSNRIIHVFGPTGGGRDSANRIKLGEISARNADIIIITTDDPYDDDPRELAKLPIVGAKSVGVDLEGRLFVILDRREAIRKALSMAEAGDVVLISGKGAEQAMVIKGQKTPWDDRMVVREILKHEAQKY